MDGSVVFEAVARIAGAVGDVPAGAVVACVAFAVVLVATGVVRPPNRRGRTRRRRSGGGGAGRVVSWLWDHRPVARPARIRQQWLYVHHANPARLAEHDITLPAGRNVLYVGVSNSATDRTDQHGEKSPWFHLALIEPLRLPWGTTRAQAEAAERRLIAELAPLCNQKHNPYLHWPTLNAVRRLDWSLRSGTHSPPPPLSATRDRVAVAAVRVRRSLIPLACGAVVALAAPHLIPTVLAHVGR